MIPSAYIQGWSATAPWPDPRQVEQDLIICRAMAKQRMLEKLTRSLTEDIAPLLPVGIRFNDRDAVHAFEYVWKELITRIKGDSWKLTGKALEELRAGKYPGLLNECR